MHIHVSEYFWWVSDGALCGVLMTTLYLRRKYLLAPVFTAWITEVFFAFVALVIVSGLLGSKAYTFVYWFFALLEVSLQVAVALEFGTKALRGNGTWLQGARTSVATCCTVSIALAAILTASAEPSTIEPLDRYYTRLTLFSSLLVFFLTVSIVAIAYRFGSLWRRSDLWRLAGFVAWSMISALSDAMHVYWRFSKQFSTIELLHMVLSEAVLLYWITVSWLPNSIRSSTERAEHNRLVKALEEGFRHSS